MAAVRLGGKRVGTLTPAPALAALTTLLLLLLLLVVAAEARQFVVGDGYHWQAPPPNDSRFYQEWADKVSPITVGDSLTFILESGSYSVYQVNQTGFAACNSSQGREVAHGGAGGGGAPTSVPFKTAGPLYFIDPAHCAQGMMFQILVNPLPVHPEPSGPVKPHRGAIDASRYVSTSVIAALAAAAGIAILCILAGFIWCAFYKTRTASPQQQHDLESSSGSPRHHHHRSAAAAVDKYATAAGPHHTLRSPPMFSATETDQRIVLSASQRARSFTSAGASPLCVPAATAAAAAARVFSFRELSDATSGFAREFLLSDGGGAHAATVYRARVYIKEWEAMRDVAISRPAWPRVSGGKIGRQEVRRVKAEVGALAGVRHRNVAQLLGWSWHREGNAGAESSSPVCLVYEFGARGGVLADYLFMNGSSSSKRRRSVSSGPLMSGGGGGIELCDGARQCKFLDWSARLQIAIDTARGLDYLHNWAHPIVHGAVCADNVWIDDGLHDAKVANFGLHNLFAGAPTAAAGYHADDPYTDVSDVYGFGVLLLTLLTSQKPCGSNTASFVDPFLNFLADSAALDCILDPELKQSAAGAALDLEEAAAWADWAQEMTVVAKIAAACLVNRPESRPSMRDVLFLLENVRVDRTLPPYREVRDHPHHLHQVAPPPPRDWTITNT